jgi:hypothetical protein
MEEDKDPAASMFTSLITSTSLSDTPQPSTTARSSTSSPR